MLDIETIDKVARARFSALNFASRMPAYFDADDFVQEILIELLKSKFTFQSQLQTYKFLQVVCLRKFIQLQRKFFCFARDGNKRVIKRIEFNEV